MILLQNHQNVQWTLSMLTKMTTLSTYWLYSSWWNQHWEVMIAKICLPHRCRTVPKLLCCYCFKQIQMPANNCRPLEKFHIFYEKFAIIKYILYLKIYLNQSNLESGIWIGSTKCTATYFFNGSKYLNANCCCFFFYKKYLSANSISQKVSAGFICEKK